jgi:Ras GTPase-activating protein-binding protein 1
MRRFMQTFVLAPQTPKRYYVRNDIFHYQDEVFNDDEMEQDSASVDAPSGLESEEVDDQPHVHQQLLQQQQQQQVEGGGGVQLVEVNGGIVPEGVATIVEVSAIANNSNSNNNSGVPPPSARLSPPKPIVEEQEVSAAEPSVSVKEENNSSEQQEEQQGRQVVSPPVAVTNTATTTASAPASAPAVAPAPVTTAAAPPPAPVVNNSAPKTYANLFKNSNAVAQPPKVQQAPPAAAPQQKFQPKGSPNNSQFVSKVFLPVIQNNILKCIAFVMMLIFSPAAETTCWITLIYQYHPNLSELIFKIIAILFTLRFF